MSCTQSGTLLAITLALLPCSALADIDNGRPIFAAPESALADSSAPDASPTASAQPPATVLPAETRTTTNVVNATRPGSPGIHQMIVAEAARQGVPAEVALAVVQIESRFNPAARNGAYHGLTQISLRTARGLGFGGSSTELMQPATNLRYGMTYLARAWKLAGGDLCGTVMRYQSGHGARAMSTANRVYCSKARTIIASR
jgi:soluble lytic murein transglycosylase-like protein